MHRRCRGAHQIQSAVRHRILDLAPPEHGKLSRKLRIGATLDFTAFRDEIKRVFCAEIPIRNAPNGGDLPR